MCEFNKFIIDYEAYVQNNVGYTIKCIIVRW